MISVIWGPCPRIERQNFPSHDGSVSEDLDRELLPGSLSQGAWGKRKPVGTIILCYSLMEIGDPGHLSGSILDNNAWMGQCLDFFWGREPNAVPSK